MTWTRCSVTPQACSPGVCSCLPPRAPVLGSSLWTHLGFSRRLTCTLSATAAISCGSSAVLVGRVAIQYQRGGWIRACCDEFLWFFPYQNSFVLKIRSTLTKACMRLGLLSSTRLNFRLSLLQCAANRLSFCQGSWGRNTVISGQALCLRWLSLCEVSLQIYKLLWMLKQSASRSLLTGSLGCPAFSIAANNCCILPYPVLRYPPAWFWEPIHSSDGCKTSTNPNTGQDCCSARHAVSFSLGN